MTKQKRIDVVYGGVVLLCAAITVWAGVKVDAGEEKTAYATCEPISDIVMGEPDGTHTFVSGTIESKEEPSVSLYDVPLDEDLQKFIIAECGSHGIDPAIIIAMAWKESNYKPGAVGDGGKSFGLLQIQERWHRERMERLGVSDLLDPYQNVMVAVDYMTELIRYYGGNVEMAVVAYNMGQAGAKKYCFDYGVYSSKYSRAVMEKVEELRGDMYVSNG